MISTMAALTMASSWLLDTTRSVLKAGLVVLFAGCASWIASANGQEMFDWSEPAPNAILAASPATMKIKFLEGIYFKDVRLTSSDNTEWPLEWTRSEEDIFDMVIGFPRPLPPGQYQLLWSAYVRQHYHDDSGIIKFTIAP